jgi:hypothetical protein
MHLYWHIKLCGSIFSACNSLFTHRSHVQSNFWNFNTRQPQPTASSSERGTVFSSQLPHLFLPSLLLLTEHQWLTLLLCIPVAPGTNLGPHIGPGKCLDRMPTLSITPFCGTMYDYGHSREATIHKGIPRYCRLIFTSFSIHPPFITTLHKTSTELCS